VALSARRVKTRCPSKRENSSKSTTVTGLLKSRSTPLVGQIVTMVAGAPGGSSRVVQGTAKTDSQGSVTFTVTPSINTEYMLVLETTNACLPASQRRATA
jgi:hypothetical protein